MTKVITYGTFDLLHYGHIRLLERAKALGDYLIVGVTADDFDKTRGKINVKQTLMERVEAVRATGIADEIIIEEYEGQKIDDIKRYDVDIFAIGSDWIGKFEYLEEICKVVYLERTRGISSSKLRSVEKKIRIGLVGESTILNKVYNECSYVNGADVIGIYTLNDRVLDENIKNLKFYSNDYDDLLDHVDALYIISQPEKHYKQIKKALCKGVHVLCESPICLKKEQCKELFSIARERNVVLYESIKTAYATAYERMILLAQSGKIGEIVSVDATCTSLRSVNHDDVIESAITWNSINAWGPTAMLPILQLLGCEYESKNIISKIANKTNKFDDFTKIDFRFKNAVASIKVGCGVKSEGELIISGTGGYIYVPAPWWKTDYFELRYENPEKNRRYFYQLDGEGIRYEFVAFIKAIKLGKNLANINQRISEEISGIIEDYYLEKDVMFI